MEGDHSFLDKHCNEKLKNWGKSRICIPGYNLFCTWTLMGLDFQTYYRFDFPENQTYHPLQRNHPQVGPKIKINNFFHKKGMINNIKVNEKRSCFLPLWIAHFEFVRYLTRFFHVHDVLVPVPVFQNRQFAVGIFSQLLPGLFSCPIVFLEHGLPLLWVEELLVWKFKKTK